MGTVKHVSRGRFGPDSSRLRTANPPRTRPLAPRREAARDCLDCTISRLGGHRLCQLHWRDFTLWLVEARRSVEFRRARTVERDRMVRRWLETGADDDSNQLAPVEAVAASPAISPS